MIAVRCKDTGRILPTNVLERLMEYAGDTDEECWEHPGSKSPAGHVRIRLDDKSRMMVHRLAWEAHHAMPIPEGGYILHECDNPCCFNPNHLYLGTLSENQQDRFERNRESCLRKLSLQDYDDICASNESDVALAERYEVTPTRIRQVRNEQRS